MRDRNVGIAVTIAAVVAMGSLIVAIVNTAEVIQELQQDRDCGALYTTDADIQACTGRPINLTGE